MHLAAVAACRRNLSTQVIRLCNNAAVIQEAQVGAEKVAVAQILKDHNVLVRGGPEQGTKLMDALLVSRCCVSNSTLISPVNPKP